MNANNAPAFFDLQINGCLGVDFNGDNVSPEDLHNVCARLHEDGVEGVLITVVTDDIASMCRRLKHVVDLRTRDDLAERMIAGLHIEGPFINETAGYRGAHPLEAIQPANVDDMQRLLEAGGGLVRLVTLAPERDPNLKVTRRLANQGLAVAAGHSDASLEELTAAIDAGLSIFTHVGNGCPMEMHRHDNILQRILFLADKLMLSLIPDGAHLPFFVLKNIIDFAGIDHCLMVTDSMAAAGLGPGKYTLGHWELVIGEDMVARSPDGSHLVGSTITMPQCAANLRRELGLTDEQIHQLTAVNPRKAVGLDAST